MKTRESIYIKNSQISPVIQGVWQLSNGHSIGLEQSPSIEGSIAQLEKYRQAGITPLDFGDIYVGVEEIIGEYIASIREKFGDDLIKTLRFHTKYVPDIDSLPNHGPKDVRDVIERSRTRLGLKTIDLVQFHWWDYEVPRYVQGLRELFKLKAEGVIRDVGVTNFNLEHMHEFIESGLKPFSIQLQYSILDRRPEKGMIQVCQANGVNIFCYGTVAGGFLSEKYLGMPEPEEPYENRSLKKYKLIIDELGGWNKFQELLVILKKIAAESRCDIATIASAYILGKPGVQAIIVGARNTNHLAEHSRLLKMRVAAKHTKVIDRFLEEVPILDGCVYDIERYNPIHSNIMQKSNNKPPPPPPTPP